MNYSYPRVIILPSGNLKIIKYKYFIFDLIDFLRGIFCIILGNIANFSFHYINYLFF